MVEPFPQSFDAATSGWQWPGAYPYAAADSAYSNFLACLKALYIGVSLKYFFQFEMKNLIYLKLIKCLEHQKTKE